MSIVSLSEIKNRFPGSIVKRVGSKSLFEVIQNERIIYLSYRTIVAMYNKQDNTLDVNPTSFNRTTTRHINLIKRDYPNATIKTMEL